MDKNQVRARSCRELSVSSKFIRFTNRWWKKSALTHSFIRRNESNYCKNYVLVFEEDDWKSVVTHVTAEIMTHRKEIILDNAGDKLFVHLT